MSHLAEKSALEVRFTRVLVVDRIGYDSFLLLVFGHRNVFSLLSQGTTKDSKKTMLRPNDILSRTN